MSANPRLERLYQLIVRSTLVAAALLLLVSLATAMSARAPIMLMWAILAAMTGVYARQRLFAISDRAVGAAISRQRLQTKSSATSS